MLGGQWQTCIFICCSSSGLMYGYFLKSYQPGMFVSRDDAVFSVLVRMLVVDA